MTIENTTNIIHNLNKIENLIIDFSIFSQTELLISIRSELRCVIEKIRKYFQLKSILGITNDFIIIVSSAIEREALLNNPDIDILLYINDLLSVCCQYNFDDISEISNLTNYIACNYMDITKQMTNKISLIKRTSYLKFDDIYVSSYDNDRADIQNYNKFKHNLNVTSRDVDNYTNTEYEIKIKNASNENNKQFNLSDISKLLMLLIDNLDTSKNNSINIPNEQIIYIKNVLNSFKEMVSNDSVNLLNSTSKQYDVIDNYIDKLSEYSDINSTNIISNTYNLRDIHNNKSLFITGNTITVNYSTINTILANLQKLNEILTLKNKINDKFTLITNKIDELEQVIISHTMPNISQIIDDINDNRKLVYKLFDDVADKFSFIEVLSKRVYYSIDGMRCKPFADFIVGLNEYVYAVSSCNGKSVTLKTHNADVLITADLWLLFENIIPTILKYIIFSNISDNKTLHNNNNKNQFISLSVTSHYGYTDLIFMDNGDKKLINQSVKSLKDTIKYVQSHGGRVFIDNKNGNMVKFRFRIENYLCNCMILEADNNCYAIMSEYCEQITKTTIKKHYPSTNVALLANGKHVFNKDEVTDNYILFSVNKHTFKLYCDRVIGTAMLSPLPLTDNSTEIPFSFGKAQFEGRDCLLLDPEQIANIISKSK